MYEEKEIKTEEKKKKKVIGLKINYRSAFKKIGILLLIVFSCIFLSTKISQNKNNKIFEENLDKMKTSAYNYFKKHDKPSEKDETYMVSLQELIDTDFSEILKDKQKNECDTNESNVELVKKTDTKYHLIASLTCNQKTQKKEYDLTYTKASIGASNNTKSIYYKLQKGVSIVQYQYHCPEGYILNGKYCYSSSSTLTTKASVKYKTISSRTIKANYKRETDIYEYVDAVVNYQDENYTCSNKNATLVGDKCVVKVNPIQKKSVEYSCQEGDLKNKKCYVSANESKKYSCFRGNLVGNQCKTSTSLNKGTCSNGYSIEDGKCVKYTNARESSTYTCPNGYQITGSKCYISADKTEITKYVCSNGYQKIVQNDGSSICSKSYDAKKTNNKTTYTCPTGYESKGYGKNLKCYKKTTKDGYYYCKNTDYRLENDKCIRDASKEFIGYVCPSGYHYNGNNCVKILSGNKVSATKTNNPNLMVTYKWSNNKDESGWTWTGETKEF